MALLGELGFALISAPQTSIGGILPDVVIEESYRDSLLVTDHPVEIGAPVTDHAFKRPETIEIKAGFSNSSAGTEGYIEQVYQQLLQLQQSRRPFQLFTPRRRYKDMLISELFVVRDEHTNSALAINIACRKIILVSTQQTGNTDSKAASDQSKQADPKTTAGVTDTGNQVAVTDQSFAGAYNSPVGVGGNTMFLGPGGVNSLGGSGGLAGFDEITFTDPSAPLFSDTQAGPGLTAAPEAPINNLTGNVGMFGQYHPQAFGR